jgi:YcxB-like protein
VIGLFVQHWFVVRLFLVFWTRAILKRMDYPADETVNLSFRYTEQDYVRAVRAHLRRRLRLPIDIFIVLALGGLGAFQWRFPETHWYGLAAVTAAVLFGFLLIAGFTVIPSLMFRREPKFHDDYSLTFSSNGIHFKTAYIDSYLQWSIYTRVLVDAYSYLLFYGSHRFTVIPIRSFQNAEERASFERILSRNIKQIVRRN